MRNDDGFVIVEVLMNGVAVGGLAAIVALMAIQSVVAFPRWSDSRDRAYVDILRWDLENVEAQQALYRADHGTYAGSVEELGLRPSEGVEMSIVATRRGWSATAGHEELGSGAGCAVYRGSASPPEEPVTPARKGQITCSS